MGFLVGIISLFIAFMVGVEHGFTAGFWTFILIPAGVGLLQAVVAHSINNAGSGSSASGGRRTITMEYGVDLLQKCIYLTIHGAMTQNVCNRIESELGNEKMSNARPLRDNELKPPVTKLDVHYADEALRTVLASGYLYAGEGEEIEARMEAKVEAIRDEYTDLSGGKKSDTDRAVDNMMDALR